jgi:hypothetical protein
MNTKPLPPGAVFADVWERGERVIVGKKRPVPLVALDGTSAPESASE